MREREREGEGEGEGERERERETERASRVKTRVHQCQKRPSMEAKEA